jgi:hypothetical protein
MRSRLEVRMRYFSKFLILTNRYECNSEAIYGKINGIIGRTKYSKLKKNY